MAFAEAIESATSLELVILTANKISDDGAFALAKAIRSNPALRVVDCDMNTRVSQAGGIGTQSTSMHVHPLASVRARHVLICNA